MARGRRSDGETHPPRNGVARSTEDTRARIGDVLRRAYEDAVAEPVPDVFAELLRRLD